MLSDHHWADRAGGMRELRRRRAAAQLLADDAARPAREVAGHLLAVQAQDRAAVRYALLARGVPLDDPLDGLVSAWLLRGTLHLVREEDHGWLLALTGHLAERHTLRRLRELDVPEEAGLAALAAALADGPLDRHAIAARLADAGLPADGQRTPSLIALAASRGALVLLPDGRAQPSTTLRKGTVPLSPAGELARRYLRGHGPADARDLATWSGLALGVARAELEAIAGEVEEVGGGLVDLRDREPPPRRLPPKLLPAFDPYLLGWHDRGFAVAPEHARAVHPGGGIIRATMLADGAVVGTWRRDRGAITLEPFAPLPPRLAAAFDHQVHRGLAPRPS